jgi:hypothetical protein
MTSQTDEELPEPYRPRSRKNSYENLPAWLAQELDSAADNVSPNTLKKLISKCVRKKKFSEYRYTLQTDSDDGYPQTPRPQRYRPTNVYADVDPEGLMMRWFQMLCVPKFVKQFFTAKAMSFVQVRMFGFDWSVDDTQYLTKLVEDCYLLARMLVKAQDMEDRILAVSAFAKLRTNSSLILDVKEELVSFIQEIFLVEHPTSQSFEDVLKSSRDILDRYDEVKNSKLFKKIYRVLMYAMAFSLFEKAGIKLDKYKWFRVEQEVLKKKYYSRPDFVQTCLDTALFICERGYQVYQTGKIEALLHSGEEYGLWFQKALDLKRDSLLMSNPEIHGLNVYTFLAELNDTIDQGKSVVDHAKRLKNFDANLYGKILEDLKLVKAEFITKRAAMQERKAPFSVLLSGGTSVNKSGLAKLLFYQYAALFKLDNGSEFKYTRNSIDQYWVNFNTYQWCVQLDDVAFLNPTAAPQGDPSLLEMLQVINNVPFVPIQAALEDKGRTPLLSRLVIATTNTEHLNAHAYFSCPGAIQRRFPWVLDVRPHPDLRSADGRFNTTVARDVTEALETGHLPNFWDIVVKEVVVRIDGKTADLVNRFQFTDIYKFVQWFSEEAMKYERIQSSAMMADAKMKEIHICDTCRARGLYTPCLSRDCPERVPILEQQSDELAITPLVTATYHQDKVDSIMNRIRDRLSSEIKETVKDEIESKRLREWKLCLIVIFWWVYSTLPFIHWFVDFLFGKDFALNYVKQGMWEKRIAGKVVYRLGSQVADKIGRRAFFKRTAALIAAGVIVKKSFDFYKSYKDKRPPPIVAPEPKAPVPKPPTPKPPVDNAYVKEQMYKNLLDYVDCTTGRDDCDDPQCPVHLIMSGYKASLSPRMVVQGSLQSREIEKVGAPPKPMGDERPNVWYKDDYETTDLEISPQSKSLHALSWEEQKRVLLKNCVALHTTYVDGDDKTDKFPVRAVCLGGKVYITNNHAICDKPEFDLHVRNLAQDGICDSITLRITQDQIMRFPKNDLAVLTLRGLPPRKNIWKYFGGPDLKGVHSGSYIGKDRCGKPFEIKVDNIRKVPQYHQDKLGNVYEDEHGKPIIFNDWTGVAERPTIAGECGSLLVSHSPMGPILLGIHGAGITGTTCCAALPINSEFARLLIEKCQPYVVQDGSVMLSAPSAPVSFGPLHKKSPFRYIPEGTATVFGSVDCPQSEMKSRVRPTLLAPSMKARGYKMKWGKPVLNGWEPKHVQLKEMLKPASKINPRILERVKQDFIHDILCNLTPEDLDSLYVFDVFTAVNGAAGVAYVDKLKRTTSAGFPWKRSKKHFWKPVPPAGDLQDPIEFDEEIMQRVDNMHEQLLAGKRAMPVSDACFKDEAVKQEKVDAKKTRIFAGSPVDSSILIRMYTLAFTRLFYKKHVLFESAPGIDASSPQWTILYKLLTKFGEDRMIAGDYAFYDKTMFALMILAAWDIIVAVCKKGKFSPEQIAVLERMGEDAAFPLYNFFGDLVMFFGTLPSGHPLTVIINSLANCLYMRYCYACLSPDGTAKDFKKNVSLMTYGDDNIMGVSKDCNWFNHTSIMNVLASIGITYTMADKNQPSIPYIHIDDCTFLKRSWRWDEDLGYYTAPLPEDSIIKSLMIGVQNRTNDPKYQAVVLIGDALFKYFDFGKEVFHAKTTMLRSLVHECNLGVYVEPHTFRSWEEIAESFVSKAKFADECFH